MLQEIINWLQDGNHDRRILTGEPGTGKSYTIAEINDLITVNITATTNKAAKLILGETIHSYLNLTVKEDENGKTRLVNRFKINIPYYPIIIDECSMINRELYGFLPTNRKILFVGDKNQLPPVNDTFSIFNQGYPEWVLTTNYRQLQGSTIPAIAREGIKPSKDIIYLNKEDYKQELYKQIKADNDNKALAYTNKRVEETNNYIRKRMVLLHNVTSNTPMGEFPSVGEKVVFKTSCIIGGGYTPAQTEGRVEKVTNYQNYGVNLIEVTIDGKVGHYTNNPAIKAELYKKGLKNILNIVPSYCTTIHQSQGSTYNNVLIDLQDINTCKDKDTRDRLIYVALTRARNKVYVYTGEDDGTSKD